MRGTRTGRGIGTGIAALALATGGGITTGLLPAAARQAAAPARAATQRADGTLIVGRGLPAVWLRDGRVVRVANFPATDGHRVSFTLTGHGGSATLRFTRGRPAGLVLVQLPGQRTVTLRPGARRAVIRLH
jgi:hypothetical protein